MSKTVRAQAELARLHAHLLELGSLAEGAGALAAHLDDSLVVWGCSPWASSDSSRSALKAAPGGGRSQDG